MAPEDELSCPDADLLVAFLVFWLASAVRAALGILDGESFAAEGTLAVLSVVLVP